MVNIPKGNFLWIGKHRERAIYERPDGHGGWMQTRELPSDPEGRQLYIGQKGYRLLGSDTLKEGLACPLPNCDFVAETSGSLGSHLMRKHKEGDISKK